MSETAPGPQGSPAGAPPQRTPLEQIGEFGLIDRITRQIPPLRRETRLGIGDDAAIINPPNGYDTLITTDILLQGVHFNPAYFPLVHLGYKAISVNVSDLVAMNAYPAHATVTLGIPARFAMEDIDALYEGVRMAAERYGIDIIGGDTSTSITGLTISVTAIGYAPPEMIVRRTGARPNQLIAVTGNLGAAYMGLQLLEREQRVIQADPQAKTDLNRYAYLLTRMLAPSARIDASQALRKSGIRPTAMIDVSDGLSSELIHIARSSNVGVRIFPERIPIDQQTFALANEMGINPLTAALSGGEDYELLFTVPLDQQQVLENAGVAIIGHTTPPQLGCMLVTADGREFPLQAQGWQAFQDNQS